MRLLEVGIHELLVAVDGDVIVGSREPAVPGWWHTVAELADGSEVVGVLDPSALAPV